MLTYVLEFSIVDCLIHLHMYVLMPLTHPPSPPRLLVDTDILPTLLLLDHSNSAVQTNAALAPMVRGEGEGRGGYQELVICADECGK